MLPATIDNNQPYAIVTADCEDFLIIFGRKDLERPDQSIEPLWGMKCRDETSCEAACRWFLVRRALWQSWGRLIEGDGAAAYDEHIRRLMAAEPFGPVQATLIQADPEPRVLNLGDMVWTHQGIRSEILYSHRFSTPGKRKRFYDWLVDNVSSDRPARLMDVGVNQGTAALAKALECIASGKAPDLPPLEVA